MQQSVGSTRATIAGRAFFVRRLSAVAAVTAGALGFSALVAPPAFAAPATHTIADVQGSGPATPIAADTVVTVQGVVTAHHKTGGYAGFYLQTAGSGGQTDATPGQSDGIFVFLGDAAASSTVAIGDSVSVTGPVSEYFGLTQITASANGAVEVLPETLAPPVPTPLPDTVVGDEREAFEGMLVAPTGTYLLSSMHQVYNFGSLWLSAGDDLPVKSTEQVQPGPAADAIAAANRASRILLDDGYSIQISNADHPGAQPYLSADTVVRNGDTVDFPDAPYVLHYGFDEWRLQPVIPVSDVNAAGLVPAFASTNPRPVAPPAVGGDASFASFNVLNYFTTLGERGASTPELFELQKGKIVAAINQLGADIVGLQEIENSVAFGKPADTATVDLVAALNAALGGEVWAYVPTPTPLTDGTAETDAITNAIIYKTAAATPVGASQTQVDESVWFNAREPIAQTFDVDGLTISVIANHFKSKGGDGEEPADGQGLFNEDRTNQAEALVEFVGTVQQTSGSDDVLLLGDFNAYAEEDPIDVFAAVGYADLVPERAPGEYTYTFDGELGSLDHAIATPSLAERITGVGVWNINSPEWSDREYRFGAAEAGTVYRSSDHDPIKVGLDTPAVSVDVVSINDFHGRLEANGTTAGAAVLSSAVNFFRANNPNTLFAAAGDNIGASTFTSFIQNDEPTIDALNAMALDVSAFGNHEFDQGRSDVDDRVLPSADFPYLGANIYDRSTGEPAYDEYFVAEVDGVRVGFIGALTEAMPSLVTPEAIASLEFRDIVTEVNRVAADLRDGDETNGEADVTVLLVHEGAATGDLAASTDESEFGRIATQTSADVNAIVSGHTHMEYNHLIPVAGTNVVRPVLQSGEYGTGIGHLNLSVNSLTGELLSITSEVIPLTLTTTVDGENVITPTFDPANATPAVVQIVADAVEVADELGAAEVGGITADFNRAQAPNASGVLGENRGGESTLGNFVADVQLSATQDLGTQIAFMNPGGLRADLSFEANPETAGDGEGVVTYREAAEVQPFANSLIAMDLTGEQIVAVLEEQWQPDGSTRPFLKLGVSEGFEYTYDPDAARGERITAAYLNGERIEPTASYRVVVNSFLASGGDNFFTFAGGTDRADSGRIDLQSMVDYFEANPLVSPDYAQRAVGVSLSDPADADGYVAGESVTADLSSLVFSSGGPVEGTVTLSLNGVQLASAPIDGTIVPATDEQGRASLTFTVPEGLDVGAHALTVSVAETGTEATVPLLIAASEDDDTGGGNGSGGGNVPAGGSSGDLASTGADALPIALLAMLLLGLGFAARRANAIRLSRAR